MSNALLHLSLKLYILANIPPLGQSPRVIIYERERYKNSISNGQGIIETNIQDKAYQEIQNLSLEIFK